MTVEELTPQLARKFGLSETSGLIVVQVQRDSSAAEAGLRPGDLILEIDQDRAQRPDRISSKRFGAYKKGDTILFLVRRAKQHTFSYA